MSAQINLYHARYQHQRELLSLPYVVAAAVAATVVIVGASLWTAKLAEAAKVRAIEAEALTTAARAQMEGLTMRLKSGVDPVLQNRVTEAQQILAQRESTETLLKTVMPEVAHAFSDIMRGFSRSTLPGIWLTGLTVKRAGASIEIHGRTTEAATLPNYIGRLGADKAFAGREFAALDVARPQTAAAPASTSMPYLEFTLRPIEAVPGGKKP